MVGEKHRGRLLKAIEGAGMPGHTELLLESARECVHLFYTKPKGKLAPGASKIGGLPDLPESVEWPDGVDGKGGGSGKARFLAQFNLADVPAVAGFDLPREGHLWLFRRNESLITTPAAVIYREGNEPLAPRAEPKSSGTEDWDKLREAELKFGVGISLPFSSRALQRKLGRDSNVQPLQEALSPGMDNYGPRQGIDGQLGGYSYQAEVDLCREFAIAELGHAEYKWADVYESVKELEEQIERGNPFSKRPEHIEGLEGEAETEIPQLKWIVEHDAEIQAVADSYQLLCMFRPSLDVGLSLGDGMYLDFLMRREALENRDFSNVRCVFPMLL